MLHFIMIVVYGTENSFLMSRNSWNENKVYKLIRIAYRLQTVVSYLNENHSNAPNLLIKNNREHGLKFKCAR